MKEPRAKTAEEIRDEFLSLIHAYVNYWDEVPNQTSKERLDGLAFSILNIFDGSTAALPSFDIVCAPHSDDEDFHKGEGENWYPAVLINNCHLHELYYKQQGKK